MLLTIPDNGSNPNIEAINEAIIAVAQENSVPLLNAARALNELSSFNLGHVRRTERARWTADAVSNYGINALNLDLLRVLSDARNIIFPDASARIRRKFVGAAATMRAHIPTDT